QFFVGGETAVRETASQSIHGNQEIFQTERYGLEGYSIPVQNGTYLITLHFSETYTGITAAGQRYFSIEAEGAEKLSQVDVFAEAGGTFMGISRQFMVGVADGQLDIEFVQGEQNPMINGLEIIQASSIAYFPIAFNEAIFESEANDNQPPVEPIDPDPAEPTPIPNEPIPIPSDDPLPVPTEADYTLTPGNINGQWPSLQAGDVVFLNPGTYTGGDINLSANGSSESPIHILKTPGTSGKVIFDGQYDHGTLFKITGSHIHLGGTQLTSGWETDFVIKNYDYAGVRLYREANDLRIHHIEFVDNGTNFNGFGIRVNGQNVVIEYNRFEDNAADAIQAETGSGGTDIQNLIIRYNYGYNRLADGQNWAWNARAHTDFLQVQSGSAAGIEIYGNLIVGFTNALLLGDSWGSVTDVSVRNNFIVFEANGVSSSSKGDTSGSYVIEHNHLVIYQVDGVDGGGRSGILLKDRGDSETVTIRCNIFYGVVDSNNVNIDSSVDRSSEYNIETGNTSSFDEINSTQIDLGYSMSDARDLSNVYALSDPLDGASCTQGAPFSSIDEHISYITN
ncbi:MAG: malectin domain-containing carbohydrate-binding protein, partial [Chloroflexota bacterium]